MVIALIYNVAASKKVHLSVDDIIGALFEADAADTLRFTRMTGAVVRNMMRLSKPIVAAINGTAAGAGTVLALASDLRVLS